MQTPQAQGQFFVIDPDSLKVVVFCGFHSEQDAVKAANNFLKYHSQFKELLVVRSVNKITQKGQA